MSETVATLKARVAELQEQVIQACVERDHWKKRARRARRRLRAVARRTAEQARAVEDTVAFLEGQP